MISNRRNSRLGPPESSASSEMKWILRGLVWLNEAFWNTFRASSKMWFLRTRTTWKSLSSISSLLLIWICLSISDGSFLKGKSEIFLIKFHNNHCLIFFRYYLGLSSSAGNHRFSCFPSLGLPVSEINERLWRMEANLGNNNVDVID